MHKNIWSTALLAAALGLASCSEIVTVQPDTAVTAQRSAHADGHTARISEFHYDNVGTDVGEAIEVSALAGTDMTGWTVVLYNGSGGASYGTVNLSGATVTTCDARQVVFVAFPGIQNGDPDGLALVDAGGNVVEFLSYEGTFAATSGPANGLTSTDIGVAEGGETPIGASLQRQSASPTDWIVAAAHSFGQCNDNPAPPPPPEVDHITISPSEAEVMVGGTQQFTATAFDADNNSIPGIEFSWSSTAPLIASVDADGLATAAQIGSTEITATAPNDVVGSASLQVVAPPPPTNTAPVAVVDGPYTTIQGLPVAMSAAGSSDPDGDDLTYAWTFGDGSGAAGVSVSHTYQQGGTFTVRLIVTDAGGLAATTTTTATVLTRAQALQQAIVLVQQLRADGELNAGNANALIVKLQAAQKHFERDQFGGALGPLQAVLNQISAFVRAGKLTEADAAQLRELIEDVIASTQ